MISSDTSRNVDGTMFLGWNSKDRMEAANNLGGYALLSVMALAVPVLLPAFVVAHTDREMNANREENGVPQREWSSFPEVCFAGTAALASVFAVPALALVALDRSINAYNITKSVLNYVP